MCALAESSRNRREFVAGHRGFSRQWLIAFAPAKAARCTTLVPAVLMP